MKKINKIFEDSKIVDFLEKRQLLDQYIGSCKKLLLGANSGLDFKERKPKGCGDYSFRINKQFRVFGFFDNDNFIVTKISNHQK